MLDKISSNLAPSGSYQLKAVEYYKKVVEEYESSLKEKQSANPNPPEIKQKSECQKINPSTNDSTTGRESKKPKQASSSDHNPLQRHFSDVAKDSLLMAIVDENSKTPVSEQKHWVEIDVKLSSLVMDYVLDSQAGPHPEFDSSGSFRGYRVIRCAD
ncbi:uncharacterized protein LOC118756791 [Rhagoletis pomonella]|uniref:uncharacterized protein LOC118756791 n=1 Tax=Rhagoletis pomonella TaxID=28610 RepID=UPI00177DACEA|nr:uncharacterized protein LOC118756791 [Rhagoletis pomonella]